MASNVISIEDRIPKLKEQRKKKVNRRLMLILLLFFIMILIIVYFQSPLSKVGNVQISGNSFTDSDKIEAVSGITTQETSILNIDTKQIGKDIEGLAEIKTASIVIKFPNKIIINVEEYDRVGYLYNDNKFYQLLENGESVLINNKLDNSFSGPILKNFKDDEKIILAASQLKKLPVEVNNAISEIIYSPKKTDQFSIIAYMNDGFEVHATMRTFADKMKYYPAIVQQLDPDVKGVIDIEVGYFFQSYQSQEKQLQIESGEESES